MTEFIVARPRSDTPEDLQIPLNTLAAVIKAVNDGYPVTIKLKAEGHHAWEYQVFFGNSGLEVHLRDIPLPDDTPINSLEYALVMQALLQDTTTNA